MTGEDSDTKVSVKDLSERKGLITDEENKPGEIITFISNSEWFVCFLVTAQQYSREFA